MPDFSARRMRLRGRLRRRPSSAVAINVPAGGPLPAPPVFQRQGTCRPADGILLVRGDRARAPAAGIFGFQPLNDEPTMSL